MALRVAYARLLPRAGAQWFTRRMALAALFRHAGAAAPA
jgi:hypothetical protein